MIKFYVYLLIYMIGASYLYTISIWLMFVWLIGFILVRLWLGRELLLPYVWQIETMMFGKPLEKDMWREGEWKARKKKKFVWKKPPKK